MKTNNNILPKGWEVKELGTIAKITSGGTPRRENKSYWGGNIPWVTTSLIDFNEIENAEEFITEEGLKNSSAKLFPSGTLLMALYGQGITRGKTAILKIDATTNQACAAILLNENQADKKFIFQYLISKYDDIRNLSNTGNQENLSGELVKSIKLNLPPLKEQTAIAALLSTWDKAIFTCEALIKKYELRKKGLMQRLLSGKGKEYRLGDLGETFTGLTGKNKEDFGEGKPYIPYLNIFSNTKIDVSNFDYVRINKNDNQNKVQYGDIFFTVSSETPDEVGMASVLLDEIEELYLNSFCFGFRLHDFKTLIPEFSAYFLRSIKFRKELLKLSQGATRFNLSKNNLMNSTVTLPKIEEQTKIANILQSADKEISLLKSKVEKLKEQKKWLMQQLLTGKKRLKINNTI